MAKVSKVDGGYLVRPDTQYNCGDCIFLTTSNGDGCFFFSSGDAVSAKSGSCNYYTQGTPIPGIQPQSLFDPRKLGYLENKPGFGCKRCVHFSVDKSDCERVDKDSPGDSPGKISFWGCCDLWARDPKRGGIEGDMAELTQEKRDKMHPSEFAGPGTSFPISDPTHARLAISGATRSFRAGNISAAQKDRIQSKARARLGRYRASTE